MRNSSNHIKFIKLRSKKWCIFFNIVVPDVFSQEDVQEIQDYSPVLCAAIVREFNQALVRSGSFEKDQGCPLHVFAF